MATVNSPEQLGEALAKGSQAHSRHPTIGLGDSLLPCVVAPVCSSYATDGSLFFQQTEKPLFKRALCSLAWLRLSSRNWGRRGALRVVMRACFGPAWRTFGLRAAFL